MINEHDIANLKQDIDSVIGDNPVSITLKRGSDKLGAQTVRLLKPGRNDPRVGKTDAGTEITSDVNILGPVGLDVEKGDTFVLGGLLYEVLFVDPHRQVQTLAEAIIRS